MLEVKILDYVFDYLFVSLAAIAAPLIDMDMSYARVVSTASLTSYPVRCKM
jgi:hypothetical protein